MPDTSSMIETDNGSAGPGEGILAAHDGSDRERANCKAPDPAPDSPLAIEVTRGEEYGVRRANSSKGILDRTLVTILVTAERPA